MEFIRCLFTRFLVYWTYMEDEYEVTIVYEDSALLVAHKPSQLPTVPLKDDEPDKPTLLSLLAKTHPEVLAIEGRNAWEGGVLHRLDTPTSGLVVVAKNTEAYNNLQAIQKADLFFKEYRAVSSGYFPVQTPGFPPYSYDDPYHCKGRAVVIGSLFRRWGNNRKEVRPVLSDSPKHLLEKTTGTWYMTTVWYNGSKKSGSEEFICRLSSGFKHQVRVHMAWSGWPLDGDELYGGKPQKEFGLSAVAVQFPHPVTSKQLEIRLD